MTRIPNPIPAPTAGMSPYPRHNATQDKMMRRAPADLGKNMRDNRTRPSNARTGANGPLSPASTIPMTSPSYGYSYGQVTANPSARPTTARQLIDWRNRMYGSGFSEQPMPGASYSYDSGPPGANPATQPSTARQLKNWKQRMYGQHPDPNFHPDDPSLDLPPQVERGFQAAYYNAVGKRPFPAITADPGTDLRSRVLGANQDFMNRADSRANYMSPFHREMQAQAAASIGADPVNTEREYRGIHGDRRTGSPYWQTHPTPESHRANIPIGMLHPQYLDDNYTMAPYGEQQFDMPLQGTRRVGGVDRPTYGYAPGQEKAERRFAGQHHSAFQSMMDNGVAPQHFSASGPQEDIGQEELAQGLSAALPGVAAGMSPVMAAMASGLKPNELGRMMRDAGASPEQRRIAVSQARMLSKANRRSESVAGERAKAQDRAGRLSFRARMNAGITSPAEYVANTMGPRGLMAMMQGNQSAALQAQQLANQAQVDQARIRNLDSQSGYYNAVAGATGQPLQPGEEQTPSRASQVFGVPDNGTGARSTGTALYRDIGSLYGTNRTLASLPPQQQQAYVDRVRAMPRPAGDGLDTQIYDAIVSGDVAAADKLWRSRPQGIMAGAWSGIQNFFGNNPLN
jgi:hypothetical protein